MPSKNCAQFLCALLFAQTCFWRCENVAFAFDNNDDPYYHRQHNEEIDDTPNFGAETIGNTALIVVDERAQFSEQTSSQAELELTLSARNLPRRDRRSQSDPICFVLLSGDNGARWRLLGRTEPVTNNENPNWTTRITLPHQFEDTQRLRFVIYDVDDGASLPALGQFLQQQRLRPGTGFGAYLRPDQDFLGVVDLVLSRDALRRTQLVRLRDWHGFPFTARSLRAMVWLGEAEVDRLITQMTPAGGGGRNKQQGFTSLLHSLPSLISDQDTSPNTQHQSSSSPFFDQKVQRAIDKALREAEGERPHNDPYLFSYHLDDDAMPKLRVQFEAVKPARLMTYSCSVEHIPELVTSDDGIVHVWGYAHPSASQRVDQSDIHKNDKKRRNKDRPAFAHGDLYKKEVFSETEPDKVVFQLRFYRYVVIDGRRTLDEVAVDGTTVLAAPGTNRQQQTAAVGGSRRPPGTISWEPGRLGLQRFCHDEASISDGSCNILVAERALTIAAFQGRVRRRTDSGQSQHPLPLTSHFAHTYYLGVRRNVPDADFSPPKPVLRCAHIRIERIPLLAEYIQRGLRLNFAVSIDFTLSNTHPGRMDRQPYNLHALSAEWLNQYELAIRAVLTVIEKYNESKKFEVVGYGGAPPGQRKMDLFPLIAGHQTVFELDGVHTAYLNAVDEDSSQKVALGAGTFFAPSIIHFVEQARRYTDSTHYLVLLIITDGRVDDFEQTQQAIIAGSYTPLSIIIIGVGGVRANGMAHADFRKMVELDGDEVDPVTGEKMMLAQRNVCAELRERKYRGEDVSEEECAQALDYEHLSIPWRGTNAADERRRAARVEMQLKRLLHNVGAQRASDGRFQATRDIVQFVPLREIAGIEFDGPAVITLPVEQVTQLIRREVLDEVPDQVAQYMMNHDPPLFPEDIREGPPEAPTQPELVRHRNELKAAAPTAAGALQEKLINQVRQRLEHWEKQPTSPRSRPLPTAPMLPSARNQRIEEARNDQKSRASSSSSAQSPPRSSINDRSNIQRNLPYYDYALARWVYP